MNEWHYVKHAILETERGQEFWCYHLEEIKVRINGQTYDAKQWVRSHQIKQGLFAEEMDLIVKVETVEEK